MERVVNGVKLSGHIARNQRTALFEEDEGGPLKRTRISARYSLDRWAVERERDRDEDSAPRRGEAFDGGMKKSDVFKSREQAEKAKRVYVTDADVYARSMRMHYKLEGVVLVNGNHRRAKAVCTGPVCGGHVRLFEPKAWVDDGGEGYACPKCTAHLDRERRRQDREASVQKTHGLYEFVRFEKRRQNEQNRSYRVFVVGRCTGTKCNGTERQFAFSTWQDSHEGRLGCTKCSNEERNRRRVRGLRERFGIPVDGQENAA